MRAVIPRAKLARRLSRAVFGRPGQGRNTRFIDKKKEARRRACRDAVERDE